MASNRNSVYARMLLMPMQVGQKRMGLKMLNPRKEAQ
jgi:hypothetical protein